VRIYLDNNDDGDYDSTGDTNKAEFTYDALGRRIEKYDADADETTLYYHNNNWQVLEEYDGSNNLQRYFVYGNYIDEVLLMYDGTDHYYAHDHLYSPVALMDDTGSVEERYEYDAYGALTRFDDDFTTWSGTEAGNPYYFTGRRLDVLDDGDLKIMYYRNRYYDPINGRFLTYDPLGIRPRGAEHIFLPISQYDDTLNIYEYAKSAPTVSIDPDGYRRYKVACTGVARDDKKGECLRKCGIPHCTLERNRGVSTPGDKEYPVRRAVRGRLGAGAGEGKSCVSAKRSDIYSCVKAVKEKYPYGGVYPNGQKKGSEGLLKKSALFPSYPIILNCN